MDPGILQVRSREYSRPMLYEGKVAIVTGGASGFGLGVAERLAAEGASVVVADVDAEGGREVARATEGIFVECDVSRPEASDELVEILGPEAVDEETANAIIMAARAHWFEDEDTVGEDANAETSQ